MGVVEVRPLRLPPYGLVHCRVRDWCIAAVRFGRVCVNFVHPFLCLRKVWYTAAVRFGSDLGAICTPLVCHREGLSQ